MHLITFPVHSKLTLRDAFSHCPSTALNSWHRCCKSIMEHIENTVNVTKLNRIKLTWDHFWAPPPRPSQPATWKTSRKAERHNDMLTFMLATAKYEAWYRLLTNSNTLQEHSELGVIQYHTESIDKSFHVNWKTHSYIQNEFLPLLPLVSFASVSGVDDVARCVLLLRRNRVQLQKSSTWGNQRCV